MRDREPVDAEFTVVSGPDPLPAPTPETYGEQQAREWNEYTPWQKVGYVLVVAAIMAPVIWFARWLGPWVARHLFP